MDTLGLYTPWWELPRHADLLHIPTSSHSIIAASACISSCMYSQASIPRPCRHRIRISVMDRWAVRCPHRTSKLCTQPLLERRRGGVGLAQIRLGKKPRNLLHLQSVLRGEWERERERETDRFMFGHVGAHKTTKEGNSYGRGENIRKMERNSQIYAWRSTQCDPNSSTHLATNCSGIRGKVETVTPAR